MAAEVHVGDVGTKYRCRCLDAGVDFNPSAATTKDLIFKMPGLVSGVTPIETVTKTATVETGTEDEAGRYYLTYTVTPSDVSAGGFHSTLGKVQLQGFVQFGDGTKYHSDVQDADDDGHELRVYENLA